MSDKNLSETALEECIDYMRGIQEDRVRLARLQNSMKLICFPKDKDDALKLLEARNEIP